ncbi:MAG: hypothetical protein HN368_15280, partial [Spirochaetales bacterium]|nr:hypothetical protein [Spirochaetales bacterium]
FVLWILTGFGHPWFLYPILAWGIGLSSHLNVVVQRLKQRREMEALPDLTARETRYLQKLQRRRTGFAAHLTASASLAGFLFVTDIITGGFFPWSMIPAAVLGFGVFLHWSAYAPRNRKMKKEVRGWIEGTGRQHEPDRVDSDPRDPAAVQEAASLRRTILRQIEEIEKDHPGVGDMRSLLDTYFQQVRQLAAKSTDINTILRDLPKTDLQRDRAKLKNRMDNVQSERLKQEYENSILEVDRQLASITELSHNGEMLELRLTSAINLMKQLQIDLARVKGKSLTSTSSFGLLKEKTDELSKYLEDLEAGYEELESEL